MDAFSLLKADHRKVEQLFKQLDRADGQSKLNVFQQIKTELDLHAHIEEAVFYPALEQPEETHDLTMEAYEEHATVKKMLRELSRARTVDNEWKAQVKELQENVEHHVDEEENELFPKAEDALTEEDLAVLGEQMQAEKERQQGGAGSKAAKKSAGSKKSASKSKAGSKAAKKARGTKKAAKKRSGGKKSASGSKRSSKSSTSKSGKRSRSRKSSKKR